MAYRSAQQHNVCCTVKRAVVNTAAIVGLLGCIVFSALWIRSYSTADVWWMLRRFPQGRFYANRSYQVDSDFGRIGFEVEHRETRHADWFLSVGIEENQLGTVMWDARPTRRPRQEPEQGFLGLLGFTFSSDQFTDEPDLQPVTSWAVVVPFWSVELLSAFWPGLWIVNWWRKKTKLRLRPGFCRKCRYDLTGNTSGFCPECGAACKAVNPAGASPAAGD